MPDEIQYVEEPAIYPFQVTLTSGQALTLQKVNIDPASDFMLTGINGSSTGTYNINFKLPSGRYISNNMVKNTNLIGTASQPTAIGPAPVYRKTGVLTLDITDTSAGTNVVEILFTGIRRYPIAS